MEKIKDNSRTNSDPPLALPMGLPYEAVRDYFTSKSQNYLMKIVPDCDPVGRDPGLNLWRSHNAKTRAKEELEKALNEYSEEKERLGKDWNELSEKQESFKDAFIKFNTFYCENEAKTERATQRNEINRKKLHEKTIEIEQKRKELEEMSAVCKEMEEQLEKHKIYEDYLQSVVEYSDEFQKPMDIIRRYEELSTAKSESSKNQEENISQLMTEVTDMNKLVENKKIQIIGMNNELALLRKRRDAAKTESKKWEMMLNEIQNETIKRQSEFSRVLESLWLLYERICKDKGITPSCSKDDYEGQLIIVMRGIEEIKKIVERAEWKASADLDSQRAEPSST